MATVVPTRYTFAQADDTSRIAVAGVIDKAGEVGELVERNNFLYAAAGRRTLMERVFVPAVVTSSATPIALPDYYSRLAVGRDELVVSTRADDAVIRVQLYTTAGAALGTLVTLTHASGGASTQTATYTAITQTEILIRIDIKRNSSSATWHSIRLLEEALLAADLPS